MDTQPLVGIVFGQSARAATQRRQYFGWLKACETA
jgi:hypothetical protein